MKHYRIHFKVVYTFQYIEEAEVERFYEDLQDLLELTSPKDVVFIIGDWMQSRKSRNTWSNRHIWPWSTEWGRTKANRVKESYDQPR